MRFDPPARLSDELVTLRPLFESYSERPTLLRSLVRALATPEGDCSHVPAAECAHLISRCLECCPHGESFDAATGSVVDARQP
jgi:nitrite reductase/ring-hydroxylating ferredoxin subunit